jgi:hypothetical protein
MNQTTKRLFAIVLGVVLCFHFVMILFYCYPDKIKHEKFNFVNTLYIYPAFHQNWNLFVPAPNVERKLFVRYKTKVGFTNWEDILSREIVHHKHNRLLGNEARVLLLSNSLIYELNSLDAKESFVFNSKPSNNELKVLQFEIEKYVRLEFQLKGTMNYELLLVSSTKTKTKAYYIKSLVAN